MVRKNNAKIFVIISMMIFLLASFVSADITGVTTSSPADNAWTSNNQSSFVFTATSNTTATFGCTLVVDSVVVAGDASVNNNTETTLVPSSELADGARSWFVNCTDGVVDSSSTLTLNIDTVAPSATLNLPSASSQTDDTNVTFNFTSSDLLDANLAYTLYLDGVSNATGTTAGNATTTQFSVPYLTNGTTYTWLIQVTDEAGNSANSSSRTFTVADTTPLTTAPTLVEANVNDSDADGNIEIAWTADANAYSYKVYRSSSNITSASSLTALGSTTSTSFEDNTSANGTTYWYAVTSLDFAGNENKSVVSDSFNATANDTTIPALVSGLSATTESNGAVSLSWTALTQDVDGNAELQITYKVFRTTNISALNTSDSAELLGTTTSASYTDTGITTGTNYSYVVTSYDDAGNENTTVSSNNVSAVPSACTTTYGDWSDWTLCHSNERERSRTRTCYGGGDTTDTETKSCTRASDSSSVGSTTSTTTDYVDKIWSRVQANQENVATIDDANSPVMEVSFIANKEISNVRLVVKEQKTTPDVGAPSNSVYKYISVEKEKLTNDDITSATIEFKVEKSWLKSKGFESNGVVLERFADGEWQELSTRMFKEDDDFVYFRASTPGFSYFAVTGVKPLVAPGTVQDNISQNNVSDVNGSEVLNESEENLPAGSGSSNTFWWVLVIVLVVIAVYFAWKEYSERQEKRVRSARILDTIRKVEEARRFEEAKGKDSGANSSNASSRSVKKKHSRKTTKKSKRK